MTALPQFTPHQVSVIEEGLVELVGTVSSENYQGQAWLVDKALGYVGCSQKPPIKGHCHRHGDDWKFVTGDKMALELKPGEGLCFYDAYWGERASIVLIPRVWLAEKFPVPGQSDHDHCDICWGKITEDCPTFFQNSAEDVVCPECYQNHVLTLSLSFIDVQPDESVKDKD